MSGRLTREPLAIRAPRPVAAALPVRPATAVALAAATFALALAAQVLRPAGAPVPHVVAPTAVIEPRPSPAPARVLRSAPLPAASTLPAAEVQRVRAAKAVPRQTPRQTPRPAASPAPSSSFTEPPAEDTAPVGDTVGPAPVVPPPTRRAPVAESPPAATPAPPRQESFDQSAPSGSGDFDTSGGD